MGQFERDTSLLIDKLERWIEGFIRLTPNLIAAALVILLFWALGRWISNSR